MKFTLLRHSFSFSLCLLVWSCGNSAPSPRPAAGASPAKCVPKATSLADSDLSFPLASTVGYKGDVQRLIEGSCATNKCHDSTTTPNMVGYENAKKAIDGIIRRSAAGTMPQGADTNPSIRVSTANLKLLNDWKNSGLLEDSGTTPPPGGTTPPPGGTTTPTTLPVWDDVKTALTGCAKCHKDANDGGKAAAFKLLDTSSYDAVKASISKIVNRMNLDVKDPKFMPQAAPGTTATKDATKVELIILWKGLGTPKTQNDLPTKPAPTQPGNPAPAPSTDPTCK